MRKNYYGSLCTEMYEILHEKAPIDEMEFYLSYAEKGMKIFEPLCGSGRFFVPFVEMGFDISGVDMSEEMLNKLKLKAPEANVVQADITKYCSDEKFDYIFIPSGSISLFTDMKLLEEILRRLKNLLVQDGKFVFAVDSINARYSNDDDYKITASVKTKDGLDLILKSKNFYDAKTQTQFSPGIYELYKDSALLQMETMDFQIHLFKLGEMEQYMREAGFSKIKTYSSFSKNIAVNEECEIFIFECGIR